MPIVANEQSLNAAAINGVVISGTPSAGQVLTATGATAADWQPLPLVATLVNGMAAPNLLSQYAPLAAGHTCDNTVTSPPRLIAAMGVVAQGIAVFPVDVPNIADSLDFSATLFVTNLAGTSTLTVTQSAVAATPIVGSGTQLDWTGTMATIVGADLSWTAATSTVTSTAGGIYVVSLVATCTPD
jgi:hypothetical protein